jgi:uncharacterized protein (TIGR02231 family)
MALAKVGEELRTANARLRDIDEEIANLERARSAQKTRVGKEPQRDVAIAFDAQAAGPAKLALTYRVTGASWTPAYDAQATTDGGVKLRLTRRAQISQRTGEDWNDIALTLSTMRVARGAGAPDVAPERLSFYEPSMRSAPVAQAGGFAEQRVLKEGAADGAPRAPATALPTPVAEKAATLEASSYLSQFVAPGKVTALSDGSTRSIALSTQDFTPSLILKAAPAFDPAVYLEAQMVNGEDAPFLPGVVSVQRDGVFVGMARLEAVGPGEEFTLGLGQDERVRAQRAPMRRRESDAPGAQVKSDIQEFKTSLKNLHDFPVRVMLVDRMPYSDNSAIVIDLLSQTTPPASKAVQDRRGVIGWKVDLGPGEQKDVRFGWRVRYPGDRPLARELDRAQTFRFSGGASF